MVSPNNFVQNAKTFAIKKMISDLLKEKYSGHDDVITRICHSLITESDNSAFVKLLSDVYEAGHFYCAKEYNKQLTKMGIKINH